MSPKVNFKWSTVCQLAFERTKRLLVNAPTLAGPRFDQPFKLAVDASDSGVGAVLLQEGSDGVEHPVSYFSRTLDVHQKWYSTIEKEALALVMALEDFEVYVGSSVTPVIVFTDHNPLIFLHRMQNKNRRLMNWSWPSMWKSDISVAGIMFWLTHCHACKRLFLNNESSADCKSF